MGPKIEILTEKKLVGKRMFMSLADNKTPNLWQSFMPRRKEIENNLNGELISMQVYDQPLKLGDLNQIFEKWAAIEVSNFNNVPFEMETFILEGGLYAVFHYKGANTDISIFKYIFGEWLPSSGYLLDHRPHFEILGEKYKNNSTNSEEDIWIPIKPKKFL
jgi:AraC family transcriptional regulator